MAPTDHLLEASSRLPKNETNSAAIDVDSSTSPPVTPPTMSSGRDAGSTMRSSLPSPPPSSSSRHSRVPDQHDRDQRDTLEREPNIDRIARRLSPSAASIRAPHSSNSRSLPQDSSGAPAKTHSSSSSTSSSTSSHNLPSTLTNKHVAMAKTKTLGHLARSTSSEVDSEVANALASGRSIVCKTDWKEEDAEYLVQLIERQFPKGNIIWDWVGQQMASKGFSKNQCRSKWKRIRTKVLHGNDPPSKDRDSRDPRDQEPDELIEEDDDDLPDHRQYRQGYDRPSEGPGRSDSYRSRNFDTYSYDHHRGDSYYSRDQRDGYRSRSPPAPSLPSHRSSMSHYPNRQPNEREEDELWSDDDQGPDMGSKRYSQDYPARDRSSQHRRQSSSALARDDGVADSGRSLSAIAATPTSFGKIEWKPEDSDYLVHLIESKFASRKVDWAWVSKQMEGRGYDRTQCKSRWWRVQHRQSQSGNSGITSLPSSRGKQRQSIDQMPSDMDPTGAANGRDDKSMISDDDGLQGLDQRSSRQGSIATRDKLRDQDSLRRHSNEPDGVHSRREGTYTKEALDDDESQGGPDEQGSSPRLTRSHEHQKHIEWKEEDSQYMYRLIEKEFPVGNVVWSVIGEKMQSRGYSQTQCMSKWRRHLKNNKMPIDSGKVGVSMDIDADAESVYNDSRPAGYRRRADDRLVHNDTFADVKRFKRDGLESRRYDKGLDYRTVDPVDARLVEMEFDRYYDATGKRKRPDGEGSLPPLESGDSRHRRSHSLSYSDYAAYDRDVASRHPHDQDAALRHRRDYSQGGDVDMHSRPGSSAAYRDDGRDSYEPERRSGNGGQFVREDDDTVGIADDRDELLKNRRKPQRWLDDRRSENSGRHNDRAYASSHQRGHHRSPSASPAYRDTFSEVQGGAGEHVEEAHSMRAGLSKEPRQRPYNDPEPRGRPVGRSPDRDYVRTSSVGLDEREDRLKDELIPPRDRHDYPAEEVGRSNGNTGISNGSNNHRHRSSRQGYDYSHDYEYRSGSSRHGGGGDSYPQRSRARQDYERDSEYIDYAREDDMDWAMGRWEGRDMARLAAAVARQGRRWDLLRAQIRIPLLVSPYEDMESDLYDGMRFDGHSAGGGGSHRYGRGGYVEPSRRLSRSHHHNSHSQTYSATGQGHRGQVTPISRGHHESLPSDRRSKVPSEMYSRSEGYERRRPHHGHQERDGDAVDLTNVDEDREPLPASHRAAAERFQVRDGRVDDDGEVILDLVSVEGSDDGAEREEGAVSAGGHAGSSKNRGYDEAQKHDVDTMMVVMDTIEDLPVQAYPLEVQQVAEKEDNVVDEEEDEESLAKVTADPEKVMDDTSMAD
ncbi:hypothetical protein BGZ98_002036 [Dissophora globulifera]|nr:hypothetical protein BGZ98_002036 [Dissophora globulifera]